MNRRRNTEEMVATKSKKKLLSCSTPDHTFDPPTSQSESEAASPIPFPSTQDDPERATVVVWYDQGANSKQSLKHSTPVSTKERKPHKLRLQETKQSKVPKRRSTRHFHEKGQLPPELFELNKYVKDEFIEKKGESKSRNQVEKPRSGSEDDIFSESDSSPKSIFRYNWSLRKNVLSSKCSIPESENGLESDDSINEHLIMISQATEEKYQNKATEKQCCFEYKTKQGNGKAYEDSIDEIFGNLNDSVFERLTQMPMINGPLAKETNISKIRDTNSKSDDFGLFDTSSRCSFARHSSMPESPSMTDHYRPTTAGMTIGRHNSMPQNDRSEKDAGDSPIRCTPQEIQMKRQQAREKLLAKRLLPFTQTQKPNPSVHPEITTDTVDDLKKGSFQLQLPSTRLVSLNLSKIATKPEQTTIKQNNMSHRTDVQSQIEKKRQEALEKLRRKQGQRLSNK